MIDIVYRADGSSKIEMSVDKPKKIGLREKHRLEKYERIMSSAENLFSKFGYEDSSLEQVAERANLSPQTIYNYFSTKRDLLNSIRHRDEQQVRLRVEAALPDMLKTVDIKKSLIDLLMLPIISGYDHTNKRVWREIISEIMKSAPDVREAYLANLNHRIRCIQIFLEHHKAMGLIRPDTDCGVVAEMMLSFVRNDFRAYILSDTFSKEELQQKIAQKSSFVLDAICVRSVVSTAE